MIFFALAVLCIIVVLVAIVWMAVFGKKLVRAYRAPDTSDLMRRNTWVQFIAAACLILAATLGLKWALAKYNRRSREKV